MGSKIGENKYAKYGQPSLDLVFTGEKKSLTDRVGNVGVEFSRTQDTPSSYYKSDGIIGYAATDVPRFDHDPTTGESLGLLIEESRTNIQLNSAAPYSSGGSQIVWTTGLTAPDGTSTAVKLAATAVDTFHNVTNTIFPSSFPSGTYTYSMYAKSDGLNRFTIKGANLTDVTFDLSTGTVVGGAGGTITPAGNGWYRCSITESTTNNFYQYNVTLNADNETGYAPFLGDGTSGIIVWGWQMEAGSFPTSYIPTTPTFTSRASEATYYDQNGIVSTASTDVARDNAYFPDENGNFISAGLLLEDTATNFITNSEEMNLSFTQQAQSVWTTSAPSVTAPDGSSTGIALTCNNGAVTRSNASFTYTFSADQYTFSVWIKEKDPLVGNKIHLRYGDVSDPHVVASTYTLSGIGSVGGDYEDADFASIQKFPNDWYRCSMTFTAIAGSETIGIWFVPPLDAAQTGASIYAWGAQLEEGSYATSYIPTSGTIATRAADISSSSTSTRGADVAQITGAGFSSFYNQSEGTVFTEYSVASTNADHLIYGFTGSTDSERIFHYFRATSTQLRFDIQLSGIFESAITIADTDPSVYKTSFAYKPQDSKATFNGLTPVEDTVRPGNVPTNINQLLIGTTTTTNVYRGIGRISRLTYWPTRLPDSDLQRLTE
jgi:hypothetical protein